MSKVLEKIIYKRVYQFLEMNHILYESQYRFRNECSCEHVIIELTGHLLQVKELGQKSASIFLDLSKAFDTLNHNVLLKKLERYGIRGIAQQWFASYLENRSLRAKITTVRNKITYS